MSDLAQAQRIPPDVLRVGDGGSRTLAGRRTRSMACLECGSAFEPAREWHRHCSDACRAKGWKARQAALPLLPPPALVPPVRDQRVPRAERPKLSRMSRAILERVEAGPAKASELHAMFPGARSVRTRISEVGRHVGEAWRSRPVKGVVGEWLYWIEG